MEDKIQDLHVHVDGTPPNPPTVLTTGSTGAEPVGWQKRNRLTSGEWSDWYHALDGAFPPSISDLEQRRAVYAAPPAEQGAEALREPTDEMVERAARSLASSANRPVEDWRRYHETARWALRAAQAALPPRGAQEREER